jgi:Zn-dependent metalloprotease
MIWYAALQKLFATANFNDFVQAITKAAQQLRDNGEVPSTVISTIESAFRSVGLPS